MNDLVKVLKFGGSSLGTPESADSGFERILPIIEEYSRNDTKLIIVVSAFMGRTRQLRLKSLDAGNKSNSPEEDLILSQGEREASEYLFNKLYTKFSTYLFNVWDIPLITNAAHGEANVLLVQKKRIEEKLMKERFQIVIVPGFVGRTVHNQTTTLGFDGSDTTAVYLAGAFDCDCILLKDVVGICTADPRKVPRNRLITEMFTLDALKLSMLGSNVVHQKALSVAKSGLIIRPNFIHGSDSSRFTRIHVDIPPARIAGITFKKMSNGVLISVVGTDVRKEALLSEVCSYPAKVYETALLDTDSFLLYDESKLAEVLIRVHEYYGLDSDELQDNVFGNGKLHA